MEETTGNPAGPAIESRLADPAESVRVVALAELMKPEAEPARVVGGVAACLDHSSEKVRKLAVVVLGKVAAKGVGSEPAVAGLIRGLDASQPMPVRTFAALGLAQARAAAEPAIEALCRAVIAPASKYNPPGSSESAAAPGAMSAPASPADAKAETASKVDPAKSAKPAPPPGAPTPEDVLRLNASLALSGIGAPAVPWLRRLLRAPDPAVVTVAIGALGLIGPAARDALPDLQAMAPSADPKIRQATAGALVKVSGNPAAGLPVLAQDLASRDPADRTATLERIGELQEQGQSAGPQVAACLADPAPEVRAAAALTLVKVKADPAETVRRLIPLLDDPSAEVKLGAAQALGTLGPQASPARQRLESIEQEKEKDKRLAAVAKAALKNMGGP